MEGKTILLLMIFLHTYTADTDEDGGGQHHIVNKVDIPQEIDVDSEMSGSGYPSGSPSQDKTDEDGGGQNRIVNKVDIPQEIDVDTEMSGSGYPSGSPSQDMPENVLSYLKRTCKDEYTNPENFIVYSVRTCKDEYTKPEPVIRRICEAENIKKREPVKRKICKAEYIKTENSTVLSEWLCKYECIRPENVKSYLEIECNNEYTKPVFENSYALSGNRYEDQENCTKHLFSRTYPSAVEVNWAEQDVTLMISNKAVLFLKGSLVTRVMPSFYIFLFIISLPLNALALLTFTCKIKEKKPAVIFMSNLACVDLLFTLLLPLKIHYHLNGSHWVFGEAACRVLTSAFYCYMYCSILLMMCMSVDRLMAVVFPIASLTWRSKRNSVYVCVLVCVLAIAVTIPLLFVTQTVNVRHVGITCHDVMHHKDPAYQTYEYLFSILSCLYFFLPLVVTLTCYCTIIYSLSTKSGRLATSSTSTLGRQGRAVIMSLAVMTEFVVCFAPTNGILLYHCVLLATGGVDGEGNTSYMAYMLALCAGSSSVFLDPLLYYYGSSQCRQQIRSVFKWRRTKKTQKISSTQAHDSV